MTLVFTSGQRHETTKFEVLMEQGADHSSGWGYARHHYLAHLYFAHEWLHLFEVLNEGN